MPAEILFQPAVAIHFHIWELTAGGGNWKSEHPAYQLMSIFQRFRSNLSEPVRERFDHDLRRIHRHLARLASDQAREALLHWGGHMTGRANDYLRRQEEDF
jgi:hypothetical protein